MVDYKENIGICKKAMNSLQKKAEKYIEIEYGTTKPTGVEIIKTTT